MKERTLRSAWRDVTLDHCDKNVVLERNGSHRRSCKTKWNRG